MLAVTNNGQSTQSIQLIDVASESSFSGKCCKVAGLAFNEDGTKIYASGGGAIIKLWFQH
jgi:hypothetical protein